MTKLIANDSGASESLWMSAKVPDFSLPPIRDDMPVPEVCVVGAGIAGLSVAQRLATAGVEVMVLDHGPIGGGQTSRTSAHLSSALDDRFYHLRKLFGADGARLAAESHATAIDEIERLCRELGIACDFLRVDGYLFAGSERGQHELDQELEAAREAGLDVDFVDRAPLPFDTGRCLRFRDQAQFQPLAFLRGLARDAVAKGARVQTDVSVAGIEGGKRPKLTLADGRELRPRAIVDATGASISSMFAVPIRVAAYRSYVIAFAIPEAAVAAALYWDTEDPYHYVRTARGEDGRTVLIVGGDDHRVGQGDAEQAWSAIEKWTRERFPMATDIVARWSGQIGEPSDSLALIGELPGQDNVYVVTGDSGHGLTHGVIAGMIIPALMLKQPQPWAELYSPARTKRHGFGTLVKEAIVSNMPFRDWLSPADVSSVDEIPPGHGATVRRGIHLLAVYREPNGNCVMHSAKCPHMGGAVRWNDAEKTWDCPVHGSRFDAHGRVLNGPACVGLEDAHEQKQLPGKTAA